METLLLWVHQIHFLHRAKVLYKIIFRRDVVIIIRIYACLISYILIQDMAFKHSSYLYPFAILNRRKYNSVTILKIYIYTSFFIFWQFCKFYWYLFNNNKRYYCYYYYYYYHYYYLKKLRNSDVLFLILQGWFFSSLLHRIFEYLNIFSEKKNICRFF